MDDELFSARPRGTRRGAGPRGGGGRGPPSARRRHAQAGGCVVAPGWQVRGLDVSASAVAEVQPQRRLPALVGSLPHHELRRATFDVITMWHSLEHVHAPLEVLREAHRLLAPGGRLVVAVPNIDSLPFRWFGNAWYGLDLPRHLTHFAPRTLQMMLERAGFRPGLM